MVRNVQGSQGTAVRCCLGSTACLWRCKAMLVLLPGNSEYCSVIYVERPRGVRWPRRTSELHFLHVCQSGAGKRKGGSARGVPVDSALLLTRNTGILPAAPPDQRQETTLLAIQCAQAHGGAGLQRCILVCTFHQPYQGSPQASAVHAWQAVMQLPVCSSRLPRRRSLCSFLEQPRGTNYA